MNFEPCIVIPIYNHSSTIEQTVNTISSLNITCIIVDDGSDEHTKQVLISLKSMYQFVTLITLQKNSGKGAAVIKGINVAFELGYSHILQVDADAQHNLNDIPAMLSLAQRQPKMLVSGWPQYDTSIPKVRFYGRYVTHFWVWVETLSLSIKDSMCGFRVYPVNECMALIGSSHIGHRMDFDTEIMVRLYWQGTKSVFFPTRIIYPKQGVSHFSLFKDNIRISKMHFCLFFGMILRFPKLIRRKFTNERIVL